jgi:hypothetical protein
METPYPDMPTGVKLVKPELEGVVFLSQIEDGKASRKSCGREMQSGSAEDQMKITNYPTGVSPSKNVQAINDRTL